MAFTPYHLLLSMAIQERDGRPPAILLYADEAGLIQAHPKVIDAVREWFDVRVLEGLGSALHWFSPITHRRAGGRACRALAEVGFPSPVFVCNGQRPESYRVWKAMGRSPSFEYVEDGLDAYLALNIKTLPVWRTTLREFIFGYSWPQGRTDLMLTMPYLEGNVLFPDFARINVGRGNKEIPPECLLSAVNALTGTVDKGDGESFGYLFLLQHSDNISNLPEYLARLRHWVELARTRNNGGIPAIKAHPRESSVELLEQIRTLDAFVFPHRLPVELICPSLLPNVTVSCGLTTFILTSRSLLPNRRIILENSVEGESLARLKRWDPSIVSIDEFA